MQRNGVKKISKYFTFTSNLMRGFTLIELLMVISIIGLLSSVVISSLNSAREKAKIAKARSDINLIVRAIIYAQGETNQRLLRFAPNTNCFHCSCPPNGGTQQNCVAKFNLAMKEIDNASRGLFNLQSIKSDPWGDVYRFDGNQGENKELPGLDCNSHDSLYVYNKTLPNLPKIPLYPVCP